MAQSILRCSMGLELVWKALNGNIGVNDYVHKVMIAYDVCC